MVCVSDHIGINSVHTYASKRSVQVTSGIQGAALSWILPNWKQPTASRPVTDDATGLASSPGTLLRADRPVALQPAPALPVVSIPGVPISTNPTVTDPGPLPPAFPRDTRPYITVPTASSNIAVEPKPFLSFPLDSSPASTHTPTSVLPNSFSHTNIQLETLAKFQQAQVTTALEQQRYCVLANFPDSISLTASCKRCIALHPEVLYNTPLYQSYHKSPVTFTEEVVELVDQLSVPGSWFQLQQLLKPNALSNRQLQVAVAEDIKANGPKSASSSPSMHQISQGTKETSHGTTDHVIGKQTHTASTPVIANIQKVPNTFLPQTPSLPVACILVSPQTLISSSSPYPVIFGSPLAGYHLLNTQHPLLIAGPHSSASHPPHSKEPTSLVPSSEAVTPYSCSLSPSDSHEALARQVSPDVQLYEQSSRDSSSDCRLKVLNSRRLKRPRSSSPSVNCSGAMNASLLALFPPSKKHKRSRSLPTLYLPHPSPSSAATSEKHRLIEPHSDSVQDFSHGVHQESLQAPPVTSSRSPLNWSVDEHRQQVDVEGDKGNLHTGSTISGVGNGAEDATIAKLGKRTAELASQVPTESKV